MTTRKELIAKIEALAEECDAAGETAAGSVLRALTAALFARREIQLMTHVKEFSWRLLKLVMASRN